VRLVEEPPELVEPTVLQPPPDLPEAMHETWHHLVGALGDVPIRQGDAMALAMLVRQYHRMVDAGNMVDQYGVAFRTPADAVVVSPFLRAERDATAMFLRLAEHYGLTLASRMRLGLMRLAGQTLAQSLSNDLNS
jgi:P27 family predicted phage terminase small subunit